MSDNKIMDFNDASAPSKGLSGQKQTKSMLNVSIALYGVEQGRIGFLDPHPVNNKPLKSHYQIQIASYLF